MLINSNGNYRSSSSRPRSLAVTLTVRTGGLRSKLYNTNFLLMIVVFLFVLYERSKKTREYMFSDRMPESNWTISNEIITFYSLLCDNDSKREAKKLSFLFVYVFELFFFSRFVLCSLIQQFMPYHHIVSERTNRE